VYENEGESHMCKTHVQQTPEDGVAYLTKSSRDQRMPTLGDGFLVRSAVEHANNRLDGLLKT
jgi:hypothetical protein